MTMGPRPTISVKFSPAGRTFSFLLPELDFDAQGAQAAAAAAPAVSTASLTPGDPVVVETDEGPAIGTVTRAIPAIAARKLPAGERPPEVVRRATRDDVLLRMKQEQREREALRICQMKIRERGLPMKLTRVEQLFDGSRLIFYYTAEGRVDFRELVRDLASQFRVRIEMRQIGVRDEAQDARRLRPLRPPALLHDVSSHVRAGVDQDGEAAAVEPQPLQAVRDVRALKCCLRYELPNGKGIKHGGCADEGGCGNPTGPGGCGSGGCAAGGCGTCGSKG
jgi:hypothetical protein